MPFTEETCAHIGDLISADCQKPTMSMPNAMLERYGEMLLQRRLQVEDQCAKVNWTDPALTGKVAKVCGEVCVSVCAYDGV